MRWLFLVPLVLHPAARRACLQAARRVCPGAAVHPCGRVGLQAPADSTAHPGPEAGSAAGLAGPDRAPIRAPRIFPGQALAGLEAWLRTAGLRPAGPAHAPLRTPRTFPDRVLAGREAWLRTASLRAADPEHNSPRRFNPFLKGADRSYRHLRAERL